jgi:hypothetical protein
VSSELAEAIAKRLGSLRTLRTPHEQVWMDCFDYTFPLRSSGFNNLQLTAQSGLDKKARLVDGTGTDAARILASSLMGGLTPANSLWMELDFGDESEEEKRWARESSLTLWQNIHAANFDAAGFESCTDAVSAGWFVLYVDEDRENGGLLFEQWPLAQCYVAASKPGGVIDTVYREYELTAEQCVNEFGDECSEQTRKLATEKPDEKVSLVHAIYPRKKYAVDAVLAKNLPIASCKVEVKAKKLLKESGYHEMPVISPRWTMIPGSVYSVGPAFDALPDMKELNEIKRMELAALDIAIAGMWIAQDDGVLNPRTIKVGPRKVIVANSVDSMKPLTSGSDFKVTFAKEERLQAAIRKTFMADQLEPQDGPVKTATEVHVRVALIRQLLGPVYGRLQSEYLQPLVERCFGLAFRAGVFNPPPQSLANRTYTVKYLSPLARAQKLEEVSAIDQWIGGAAAVAEVAPQVLDTIDFDAAQRFKGEALGVPPDIIRKPKDVAAVRKARADAQAQAQQQEQMAPVMQSAGEAVVKKAVGA